MFLLQQIPSSAPPVIRIRFKILFQNRAVHFMSKDRMRGRLELMHTQQVCMIAAINTWWHNILRLMPYLVEVNEVSPIQFFKARSTTRNTLSLSSASHLHLFNTIHFTAPRAFLINTSIFSISQNLSVKMEFHGI